MRIVNGEQSEIKKKRERLVESLLMRGRATPNRDDSQTTLCTKLMVKSHMGPSVGSQNKIGCASGAFSLLSLLSSFLPSLTHLLHADANILNSD